MPIKTGKQSNKIREGVILDSMMTEEEVLRDNPDFLCPPEILGAQRVLNIQYISFDGNLHEGQLVVHGDIAEDVRKIFFEIVLLKFPLARMIPISNDRYRWDDNLSMADDNTSAFNYRKIAGKDTLSWHAYGRAIDINPARNPYCHNGIVSPPNAVYDTRAPGTIVDNSPIVELFLSYGFEWGGHWSESKDYQHFQKPF